jgi:hypothetical protein
MLSWLAHHALDLFSWGIPLLGWGFNRRHFISHRSRPRRSIFSGVHVTAHARVGRRVSRPSRHVYRTPRRQPSVRHGYHPRPSERTSFALSRRTPAYRRQAALTSSARLIGSQFGGLSLTPPSTSPGRSAVYRGPQAVVPGPTPYPHKHLTSGTPSFKNLAAHVGKLILKAHLGDQGYTVTHPNETSKAFSNLVIHPGKSARAFVQKQQAGQTPLAQAQGLKKVESFAASPYHVGKALIEHPSSIGKTARDLAYLPLSAPAAVVGAVANPVGTARAVSKDLSQRYGQGGKAIERSVAKHGAAPYLLDYATVGVGQGALLGRGLGQAAKAGAFGSRAERFAARPRPHLRISGNITRPQRLHPNLGITAAQRFEDRLRARRAARRDAQGRVRGLQGVSNARGVSPRRVVPIFQKRAQKIAVSEIQSRHFQRLMAVHHNEIDRGLHPALARLKPIQQQAIFHTAHGLVPLDNPLAAMKHLAARRSSIIEAYQRARGDLAPAETAAQRTARADQAAQIQQRAVELHNAANQALHVSGPKADAIRAQLRRDIQAAPSRNAARLAGEKASQQLERLVTPEALARSTALREQAWAHERQGSVLFQEQSQAERVAPKPGVHPPEVAVIDNLIKRRNEVFNKRLAEFHAGEVARHQRIGAAGVRSTTAEARIYRPQAHHLGIEYPYLARRDAIRAQATKDLAKSKDAAAADAIKAKRDEALAQLERARSQLDRQFVQKVKAEAARRGLPEPVYFEHYGLQSQAEGRTARTLGGRRAMPRPKESRLEKHLFAQGRADTRAIAYEQSVARQIRRGHNWASVAEQASSHALPDPSRYELQRVFGHRHVDPAKLTQYQWRQVLEARGVNPNDYALWNPGRFTKRLSDATTHEAGAVTHQTNEHVHALEHGFVTDWQQTVPGTGYKLIPRAVYNEIHAGASGIGTGLPGRLAGKAMGFQSRLLLGTNPGWFQIQVGANAFLTGLGTRGNVAEFAKSPAFWRGVAPEVRQQVDELLGSGVGVGHGRKVHLGAAAGDSAVVNGYRALQSSMAFKAATARQAIPLLRRLPTANPVDLIFAMDEANNRYFKRTLLYNQAKREAFTRIRHEAGIAAEAQARIASIFSLGPKERIHALLNNPADLQRLAKSTLNILGDYSRYTAFERNVLKRSVIFYGFMRYSVRTLFYTMPVHHPLMTAIVGKLAQLHNQEVAHLLGGDQAPWAYSRIFLSQGAVQKALGGLPVVGSAFQPIKGTKLWSIDFARLNPVTNPLVGVSTEGVKALGGFMSPALQSAFDQLYGRRLYTGQGFRVHGAATEAKSIDPATRARIVAQDFLSTIFPYRVAQQATQKGTQGDEAMLGLPAPIHFKGQAAQAREAQRRSTQGNFLQTILRQFEPFAPRPDTSQAAVKAISAQQRKRRGGKGGSSIDRAIDRAFGNQSTDRGLDSAIDKALK